MKKIRSLVKKTPIVWLSAAVLCIVLAVTVGFIFPLYRNAGAIGEELGASAGKLTGYAVGSFRGLTEGRTAGHEAGKAEGLKAEDTEVEIANAVESAGSLEVLAASVKIMDQHDVGKGYEALYAVYGDAIFTVDLTQAEIAMSNGGELSIKIPEPQIKLFIDDSKTDKVAEYIANRFQGSTEGGYEAYLNSMDQIRKNAEEKIAGLDELKEQARGAAQKQVALLAENICGPEKTISVSFK